MTAADIIIFWFETLSPKQWWIKDAALDAQIGQQFTAVHQQANSGDLAAWRDNDQGCLAEIIVLDQFSRNIYRGQEASFASDVRALSLARSAVTQGSHKRLRQDMINFLFMPYMHSESLKVHQCAWPLYKKYTSKGTQDFELKHRAIIERFGRYPHRNNILEREPTAEELRFLKQPNSSF